MPANEVLAMRPNGVLLSNGPGDPTAVPYALNNVKYLIGKVPITGNMFRSSNTYASVRSYYIQNEVWTSWR